MKLYIDTSSNKQTIVRLDKDELKKNSSTWHSQVVLPMIEELLATKNCELTAITEIEINPGPGSFVGLRVGASIANALGYALKIPVNGKKPWEMEIFEPQYE